MISLELALRAHRELIFGKRAAQAGISEREREQAIRILEQEKAILPKATLLRCRVRYFTDGAILGSAEFVRGLAARYQDERGLKYPPKISPLRGGSWDDLSVAARLRREVFG
ncbi:MAG: hypothetical protein ACNA77_02700 [Opitutales bacterium]